MSTYISEQSDWMEKWKNFELNEFKCKCGCEQVKINSDLLDLIQEARDELGPLSISSAFRCSEHNSSVSSTGPNGPHTTGCAVDITVKNSQHRKQLISWFANKVSGLGIAKSFIHIDNLTADDGFDARPNAWTY